jgi:hypothetical protein
VDENPDRIAISPKKLAANRRNAQLSTGPRTEEGKRLSRPNALKHGILARALLITKGEGAESSTEFDELLDGLRIDLAPIGMLEEMLVEKVAVCLWRQKRALKCEAGMVRRGFVPEPSRPFDDLTALLDLARPTPNPELEAIREHLSLPLGADLDLILRYEKAIQRELAYVLNQLERLQRARKGEHVPAPVNVQISSDQEG